MSMVLNKKESGLDVYMCIMFLCIMFLHTKNATRNWKQKPGNVVLMDQLDLDQLEQNLDQLDLDQLDLDQLDLCVCMHP